MFQQTAAAQDDPVAQYRIYRGVSLMNITWSPDSTHLIFQDAQYGENGTSWGVDTAGYNRWHDFSLETGETADSDYWPLQPLLTPEQWEDFEIYQRDGEETFVFQSPNGRFIAYTSEVTDGYYFAFGLADLETGQHRIFEDVNVPDVLQFSASSVDYNFVRWSPDGATFVLGAYLSGPGEQLYHFSNLSAGLADIVVRPLHEQPVLVEDLAQWTFYPRHALDVYGDQVLVAGETQSPSGFHRESSAIYDIVSKSAEEVAGKVAGAMLLPDDPSQAMSVGEDGLRRYYGTASGVLHVGITSTWANGGAYFSPDARYVAIYDDGRGGPSDLYLFETGYSRSNPYYVGPIDTLTQNPIDANTGWRIQNIRWSPDSQSIVYQAGENVGVSTEGELTWYQYHVTTGETQQADYWPLQPTLTPEQYDQFEIFTSPRGTSFIFPSPDGQYILYAAPTDSTPRIGIANLQTGQHHVINRDEAYNLMVPTINQFFDGISPTMGVTWSDDSSAVAIASIFLGAGDYVHYITNLNDLDHLVVRDLLMETSGDMRPSQLFDISADGQRLLLGNNRPGTHLIFQWDISNDTVTRLPSLGKIAGAAFYGASEDHVMYIDQGGFKIGAIGGGIWTYNPMITSTWAENGAFFSPDGQYVAIYYSDSFFDPTLYILETGLDSFAQ